MLFRLPSETGLGLDAVHSRSFPPNSGACRTLIACFTNRCANDASMDPPSQIHENQNFNDRLLRHVAESGVGSASSVTLIRLLCPHYITIMHISKDLIIILDHQPAYPGCNLIWGPGSQSTNLRAPTVPTSLSKQSSAEGGYRLVGLSVARPPAASGTQGPFN